MVIAAIFTIVRIWKNKHPFPLMDEWIKKKYIFSKMGGGINRWTVFVYFFCLCSLDKFFFFLSRRFWHHYFTFSLWLPRGFCDFRGCNLKADKISSRPVNASMQRQAACSKIHPSNPPFPLRNLLPTEFCTIQLLTKLMS